MAENSGVCKFMIELLVPEEINGERSYLALEYDFNPGLCLDEFVHLEIDICDKPYNFRAQVKSIQKHVVKRNCEQPAFHVRFFVEAEDRSQLIDLWDNIKAHNS